MRTLRELQDSFAGPGRVVWIGLRPHRKTDMLPVSHAEITMAGLTGDHGRAGKRAVTLIQAEHLPVISALCGTEATAALLRRNIVVSGVNLYACRMRGLQLGEVLLEITSPCAPCSRMELALGSGGYNAMRGHGGWCASVHKTGDISLDTTVIPRTDR